MKEKGLEKIAVILATAVLVGFGLYLQKPSKETKQNEAEVIFLNVGQGDSTLVKSPNSKYVLIDGGPDKKVLSELGEVLPPTTRTIDAIILSHPHADHVAGLNYVMDRYQVGQVYLTGAVSSSPDYVEFLKKLKEQNTPVHKAYLGQSFEDDGVSFKFLYPVTDISGQTFKDSNDSSDVVDVSYQNNHVLILGDLSASLQDKYLTRDALALSYEIMKVSHHGSKTGTSSKLLDIIKPKYSVILVGKNSFGHPAPLTLSQLVATTIKRTDQDGRIMFLLNSSGASLY